MVASVAMVARSAPLGRSVSTGLVAIHLFIVDDVVHDLVDQVHAQSPRPHVIEFPGSYGIEIDLSGVVLDHELQAVRLVQFVAGQPDAAVRA